jgi:hypothetical protein
LFGSLYKAKGEVGKMVEKIEGKGFQYILLPSKEGSQKELKSAVFRAVEERDSSKEHIPDAVARGVGFHIFKRFSYF